MNALRFTHQNSVWPAISLAFLVVMAAGCKDLTSQNNAPNLETLTDKLPDLDEPNLNEPRIAESSAVISQDDGTPAEVEVKEPVTIPATKPDAIYEPQVVLSTSHAKTCLVNVGDALPNLTLKRFTGESVSFDALRGDKLTVVVFWTNRLAFGREQFQHLATEVALPFQHLGVKVVAVNVGDPVDQIELDAATKSAVTCVLDPDGSAVGKIASSKLPRTYLLDAEGRIVWFDIEYSRTSRRQLKNAIFYCSQDLDKAH